MPHSVVSNAMRRFPSREQNARGTVKMFFTLFAGFLFAGSLTGCLLIGGSSRGGFFIFPGGLGLVLMIVVIALLLRRRR